MGLCVVTAENVQSVAESSKTATTATSTPVPTNDIGWNAIDEILATIPSNHSKEKIHIFTSLYHLNHESHWKSIKKDMLEKSVFLFLLKREYIFPKTRKQKKFSKLVLKNSTVDKELLDTILHKEEKEKVIWIDPWKPDLDHLDTRLQTIFNTKIGIIRSEKWWKSHYIEVKNDTICKINASVRNTTLTEGDFDGFEFIEPSVHEKENSRDSYAYRLTVERDSIIYNKQISRYGVKLDDILKLIQYKNINKDIDWNTFETNDLFRKNIIMELVYQSNMHSALPCLSYKPNGFE